MKLGSLFDGSGGFPLAGSLCGIEPIWASEIEPYPIAVTTSRFPKMKHYGDVSKINGAEVEPVDIISFGSPCQDLSVAGKRAGMKHEDNGDDETTRSGLFMEAIRIIKEMRKATNGVYPRFAIWENVFGAFSSNKGEDFRKVLEEFVKVVEPSAEMPPAPKGGWAYADIIVGDGWSIAYRTVDAQYWGVPQRRRRIYLVADFRDESAFEILFKRKGLRGYFEESRAEGQGTSANTEACIGADDSKRDSIGCYGFPLGFRPENVRCYEETATTLCNGTRAGFCNGVVIGFDAYQHHGWRQSDICGTLTAGQNAGIRGDTPLVMEKTYCIQDTTENKKQNGSGCKENTAYTLNTIDRPAVAYQDKCGALCARDFKGVGSQYVDEDKLVVAYGVDSRNATEYKEMTATLQAGASRNVNSNNVVRQQHIVRRLTPTECARLQGFPDDWGHTCIKLNLTDEEYAFWLDVRKTDAEINGKQIKEWTRAQILSWYNKLHTDSAEYKMWGNGIALPNALYVMQGIADELKRRKEEEI